MPGTCPPRLRALAVCGLACTLGATSCACSLEHRVEVEVIGIELSRSGLAGAEVTVSLEATNVTGLKVTFQELDAKLIVAGAEVPYQVHGLAPGEVLAPKVPKALEVDARLGLADLGRSAATGLLAGGVSVELIGDVTVSVWGLPLHVPVHEIRTLHLR